MQKYAAATGLHHFISTLTRFVWYLSAKVKSTYTGGVTDTRNLGYILDFFFFFCVSLLIYLEQNTN